MYSSRKPVVAVLVLVMLALSSWVEAVDRSKFKTCEQSSFCSRQRNIHTTKQTLNYSLDLATMQVTGAIAQAVISESHSSTSYSLVFTRYAHDIVRMQINEISPRSAERYRVTGALLDDSLKEEAFPASSWTLDASGGKGTLKISNPDTPTNLRRRLVIHGGSKLQVELWIGDESTEPTMIANERSLFYFEYLRDRPTPAPPVVKPEPVVPTDAAGHATNPELEQAVDEGVSVGDAVDFEHKEAESQAEEQSTEADSTPKIEMRDAWEESFSTHKDSKPKGPESVGLDISFIGTNYIYGLPEHAGPLNLRETRGPNARHVNADPYRLYNLDVFEYELDNEMALYGAVPFVVAHGSAGTVGLLWLNAAETWIDVEKPNAPALPSIPSSGFLGSILGGNKGDEKTWTNSKSRVQTHWMSESGLIDLFFLPGPSPQDVLYQYSTLTGTQQLPPISAVGYHQCRWNYKDEEDVRQVNQGFETNNLPMDILWLDIEHTDAKKYFTWDPTHFPTPLQMQQNLASYGRKMVVIIDPHIKRDNNYHIHSEATAKGLYVKNADGNSDYEGWCWPGSSSWLDFARPEVREWWADQFKFDNFKTSTPDLYVWNDMNEPSVFNGPEVTMHKDAKHLHGKVEHRDLHNQYGQLMVSATVEGQIRRHPNRDHRPFVLSRSFFAGSQRYGAIWTGDNAAEWSHLKASVPMLLSLGVGGIPFSGADVGGFFKDPDATLLTRWYQLGAFYPFFRAHGHIDTKRREPWLFGEPYLSIIRDSLRLRYRMLPYWYTLFHEASQSLVPIVRPMWMEFPHDELSALVEDQFLAGPAVLVKPVTEASQTSADVYFPARTVWYDFYSGAGRFGEGKYSAVEAPLSKIPVFVRGGHILPLKDRPRRSSAAMTNDPFTLLVALDLNGQAKGQLYIDDGDSFAYQKGQFLLRSFEFTTSQNSATLQASALSDGRMYFRNKLERVIVYGMNQTPKRVELDQPGEASKKPVALDFAYDGKTHQLLIRKPDVLISANWTIQITY